MISRSTCQSPQRILKFNWMKSGQWRPTRRVAGISPSNVLASDVVDQRFTDPPECRLRDTTLRHSLRRTEKTSPLMPLFWRSAKLRHLKAIKSTTCRDNSSPALDLREFDPNECVFLRSRPIAPSFPGLTGAGLLIATKSKNCRGLNREHRKY